ncbi:IS1634 family transposase [Thermodesulfobacteriota bacterium]
MASRSGPVHVVKNIRKYKGKEYKTYLLRRSIRVGKKVKKETVANLSHLPEELIDIIRRYLKGEAFAGATDMFRIDRSLPHGHVAAALGTFRGLSLERLLGKKPSRRRTLAVAMIVSRIIEPSSKQATAGHLTLDTSSSSLGEVLGIGSVEVDELYQAMDWLIGRQSEIEAALAERHLTDGSLMLYDVTSVYFEGRARPLAKQGHNRDGKEGKLQIVVGLLCNADGCPVSIQVFDGNTGDPKTLAPQIEKLRSRFGLKRVVLVGDRGMITEARLREDVRPENGLDWITAIRGPSIRGLVDSGSLQLSLFDETNLAEITDPAYPGERLIVYRNPLLAGDRARTRTELIEATEKRLDTIVQATQRRSRPLKGKDKIGLRVGKVLNRYKVGKYFEPAITDESFSYSRNEDRITQDAQLGGVYVIRTSVPQEALSAEDTVTCYRSLSKVERAFRRLKSIDLKVRPIHHHLEDRLKAHVFICMLAYYVEWHMREALAPILFDDAHRSEAHDLRESVVEPAERSKEALAKASKRLTKEGIPVQSFQGLLSHLSTLTKNTVRLEPSHDVFSQFSEATPVQRKAFDLLGTSPRM